LQQRIPNSGHWRATADFEVLRRIGRLIFKLIPLWSWRVGLYATLAAMLLAGGSILGLRYWVLPNIDAYRGHLERAMSSATGQRIAIGEVRADWRGFRPQFTLLDVIVYDDANRPALELSRIESSLAWTTLFFFEPRFHSFRIDGPHLAVRRSTDGVISVGGIELRKAEGGGGLADWVLRQPALAISGASVSWLDEQRQAPELKLEQVRLRLQNEFYRHRFGLQAVGPAGVLGAVDLRGNFAGRSVRDLRQWEGQIYLRLDDADLAAHKQWIDLPVDIQHGQGAVRLWLDIADARVTAVTADVHLAAIAATLAPGLQPLQLNELAGRVGWRGWRSGFEVSAHNLGVSAPDGESFRAADFTLRKLEAQGARPAGGQIKANVLDLGALAHFAEHLPIDKGIRKELGRYAPRGIVSGVDASWSGAWPPAQFAVKARFEQLGVAPVGSLPGLANVSGSLEANEKRGAITLANRDMRIVLPRAFAEPLQFDSLAGQVTWIATAGRYDIRFPRLEFSNADLEGSLHGTYQIAADGLGSAGGLGNADLTGNLTRADASRVASYLPLVVGKPTREWVRSAVVAGHSQEVTWRLKGNLSDFPFHGRDGTFEVLAKARDGILEYAAGWPRIENIAAEIHFKGNRLEVRSSAANILGAQLTRVHAVIPDLVGPYEIIEVTGDAQGPSNEFMRFVNASPVADKIDHFIDGMQAQGRGQLALKLFLPLRELEKSRVEGSYRFLANRLRVDNDLPPLENVDGRLSFTESTVRGQNIAAQIFGGPATIAFDTRDGAVLAAASGRASIEDVRRSIDSPLLQAFSGAASWRSTLQVRAKTVEFVVESNLEGVASSLPAPFAKAADEAVPVRIERRLAGAAGDTIELSWGKTLAANITRRRDGQQFVVERAAIGLGGIEPPVIGLGGIEPPVIDLGGSEPPGEGPGIWLRGTLAHADADRWRALLNGGEASGSSKLRIMNADLKLGTLDVFGRRFHDVAVHARQDDELRLRVTAREFAGQIDWQARDRGRVVARLQRLALPAAAETAAGATEPKAPQQTADYPALDVIVDEFSHKDRPLGRLELKAIAQGGDWRIEQLGLRNADFTLTADGYWQRQLPQPRTQMNLRLEIGDIGKFLARMHYPEGVRGGTASLSGTLGWNGAPQDIDFPTLGGNLAIDAKRGQFAKLDPGIGKLLSILSLQALPRRVKLDFKDVFSEGFAFDSIQGKVKIQRGIATTDSFRIVGSSARVFMSGEVDLNQETQALRVRVTPSVGDSVATVTALLGGPVAGIGVYLAQKLLNDPLGRLIAYDYSVTGTWSDPNISKIGFDRGFDRLGPG
jgi:uncharacterized protein (TIGR02099 family)